MTGKILMLREPEVSTYTSYGCLFSMMDEDVWPWIFNNFIQLRFAKDWGILTFDSHQLLLKNCPGISFYDLPQDMIVQKWDHSLRNVITESIDLGYYLFIYVDRYYIAGTSSYQRQHFPQELFIYGYDLERETVYVADNSQDNRFIAARCSFDELEQGYWELEHTRGFVTEIRFLKRNVPSNSQINLEQIAVNLEYYLYSRKRPDQVEDQEFEYGIQAIERLLTELDAQESAAGELDARPYDLLYEHKWLLEQRVAYLMDNGFIFEDRPVQRGMERLKGAYAALRDRVLEYNASRQTSLLQSISEQLKHNLEEEKRCLTILLHMVREGKASVAKSRTSAAGELARQ